MNEHLPTNVLLSRLHLFLLVAALLYLLIGSGVLCAQNITGTITGKVQDTSEGVVANAQVQVKNEGTGLTRTVLTNSEGNYTAPLLPVGTYTISFELPGFNKKVITGIALQVDQTATVNAVLDVGAVTQEVTASGSAPLTNTETSEVGEVIGNQRVVELPLNGRQFIQLAFLNAGASVTSGSFDTQLQLTGPRLIINGQMEQYNNYTIDGTDATDAFYHTLAISPSVDVIQEFKILTNNYSAEFGGFTGANLNVSIKSGTNTLHGTAYEFLRNDKLNAYNFFDDKTKRIPPFHQNQFGATIGGPIKRDRTFFFGGYEGLRRPKAFTNVAQVPSELMRAGNLSEFVAAGQKVPIDPQTGRPFPNNTIPAQRFDSVAKGLLDILPHVTSGTSLIVARTDNQVDDQFHIKFDHQFTNKNSFFARFSFDNLSDLQPNLVPLFDRLATSVDRNLSLSDVHVFTPVLINEFRFGFNRISGGQALAVPGFDFARKTGLQGVTSEPNKIGVPLFAITSFPTPFGNTFGPSSSNITRRDNSFEYVDNVTFTKGKHNLKLGGKFSRYQFNPNSDSSSRGTMQFTGVFTGNPYADFLLGLPASGTVGVGDLQMYGRSYLLAGYFQDHWKVSSRLTLNIGLRYEYLAPVTDTKGLIATLDLRDITRPRFVVTNFNPALFPPGILSRLPLPAVSAQDAGLPSSLVLPTKRNWAPRFGFAYRPFNDDKTVIRSGYGIFYAFPSFNWPFQLKFSQPIRDTKTVSNPLNAPFKAEDLYLAPSLGNTSAFPMDVNFRVGYSQQWFFNVQREIMHDLLVEVTYIGNKGTKLMEIYRPNQAIPGPGPLGPRRIIPQLGIFSWNQSVGKSTYNALQMRLEKRAARGLGLVVQYNFAKSLDRQSTLNGTANDGGNAQNNRDLNAEHGLSSFDHHHRLVTNFVYVLPFGPGMRFFGSSHGFASKLWEGWQAQGIFTAQDGLPFTVLDGRDQSNTGDTQDRPNLVGNPNSHGFKPSVQKFFDTTAFRLQPQFTFGNEGRNILRGPQLWNLDFSLAKNTSITERQRLEFRAECFNILNHPNFNFPDRTLSSLTFGRIFSAQDPRVIQFGLKYIF
ncbi:MAG TPA: carboxypeptidase regulatory-like domain-containing protein [Candidatus Dormibacteraeota bacterium]|nr:carboxypeptidase regulatory-like domain-containing protein [Candidatus Dormibacteraeota bacterium]